jgi:hypothetical protein
MPYHGGLRKTDVQRMSVVAVECRPGASQGLQKVQEIVLSTVLVVLRSRPVEAKDEFGVVGGLGEAWATVRPLPVSC